MVTENRKITATMCAMMTNYGYQAFSVQKVRLIVRYSFSYYGRKYRPRAFM